MALKFNCEKCKEEILVQFLKVGEVAQCKNCGADNIVPQNATGTDGEPDYTKQPPEGDIEIKKLPLRTIYFVLFCISLFGGTYLSCDSKYSYESSRHQLHMGVTQDDLKTIATYLKDYKKKHGGYPDNNKGLLALEDLQDTLKANTDKKRNSHWLSMSEVLVLSDAGVLSRWQIPLVYENRLGLDKQLFSDSPATLDEERHYSVKVDEGIYLYSVGAKISYDEYKKLRKEMTIVWIISFLVISFFLYKFARAEKPKESVIIKTIKTIFGFVMVLAAFFGGLSSFTLCYSMAYFTNRKRPDMVREYYTLLDKYHQKGIINQTTYDKVKEVMNKIDDSFKGKWQ